MEHLNKIGVSYLWSRIASVFATKKELQNTERIAAASLSDLDSRIKSVDSNAIKKIEAAGGEDIGNVGTPSVTVTTTEGKTTLTFHNLKGKTGDRGETGSVANVFTSGDGNVVTDVEKDAANNLLVRKFLEIVTKQEHITIEQVIAAALNDLENRKANKSDIPSLEGYAKTEDIPDISGKADKDEIPDITPIEESVQSIDERLQNLSSNVSEKYTKPTYGIPYDDLDTSLQGMIDKQFSFVMSLRLNNNSISFVETKNGVLHFTMQNIYVSAQKDANYDEYAYHFHANIEFKSSEWRDIVSGVNADKYTVGSCLTGEHKRGFLGSRNPYRGGEIGYMHHNELANAIYTIHANANVSLLDPSFVAPCNGTIDLYANLDGLYKDLVAEDFVIELGQDNNN